MRKLGRLDALVNNAAIADPGNGPLEKLPLAEWNRCVATNLTSVFLMTKHCASHLCIARRDREHGLHPRGAIGAARGKLRPRDHAQHPVGRAGRPQDIAEMIYAD